VAGVSHTPGHLALPISLTADGAFRVVDEDSPQELQQNVAQILRTRTGERLATPEFGIADPAFTGLDVEVALSLVEQWEPRATAELVEQVLVGGTQTSTINVQRREG
jgi:phage baseplate assembly protein W